MTVTVAICTWNRCDSLKLTLEQLTHLKVPAGVELGAAGRQQQLHGPDRQRLSRIRQPPPDSGAARNASRPIVCSQPRDPGGSGHLHSLDRRRCDRRSGMARDHPGDVRARECRLGVRYVRTRMAGQPARVVRRALSGLFRGAGLRPEVIHRDRFDNHHFTDSTAPAAGAPRSTWVAFERSLASRALKAASEKTSTCSTARSRRR